MRRYRWFAGFSSLVLLAGCARAASVLPSSNARPGTLSAGTGAVVWVQSDAWKVRPGDPPQPHRSSVRISGARGETVSFQVVINATHQTIDDREALRNRISLYDNDVAGPSYGYNSKTRKLTFINYTLFDASMVPDLDGSLLPNGARGTVAEVPDGNVAPPGPTPGPQDDQYLAYWKAVANHFDTQGWLSRNFYYDLDEPSSAQDFETVVHRADVAHKADPRLRVMDTTTIRKTLLGHIDIWTPIVNELDSPGFPPPSAYAARQKLGESVWFYHSDSSLSSDGPWPNFFVDRGMNDARIFSWMAWRYGLTGFLYYATTLNYTRTPNPWTNVYNFGDNGDGVLFYPGRTSFIGGRHDIPCPSIRLKAVRNALEDYEYMMLLHQKGQDAFVNALVRRLVVKTNNWTHSGDALEAARAAMAAKLQPSAAATTR